MNAAQPLKDEGSGTRNASPFEQELQALDCAGVACDFKRFATLQASSALAGLPLTGVAAGYYGSSRWDQTQHLETLEQVEQFQQSVTT